MVAEPADMELHNFPLAVLASDYSLQNSYFRARRLGLSQVPCPFPSGPLAMIRVRIGKSKPIFQVSNVGERIAEHLREAVVDIDGSVSWIVDLNADGKQVEDVRKRRNDAAWVASERELIGQPISWNRDIRLRYT